MRLEEALRKFLEALRRVELAACVFALLLLAAVLFGDVLARALTGSGLVWARQVAVFAGVAVATLGLGLAMAAGEQLRPRFADHWLPSAWNATVRRAGNLLAASAHAAFAWLGVLLVVETAQLGELSTVLRIPLWPVQALLPLGFAIAALRHVCWAAYPGLQPPEHAGVAE